MRSIIRGVVALFAAFLMMDVANAAPTIVSPADYSSISTMTETFKGYLDDPNFTSTYFNYQDYGQPNSVREAQREEFFKNSAPVTVSWSGAASGTSTVKIWRTHKDTSSTPVFTKTTTESSVTFFDLEIGRNYTWTVTDSAGETATGHFYTLRHAPRMIKAYNTDTEGSACSNGRDIGGRLTADGTKAVKQGLIYRTAQLEYCNPRNADGIYGEMTWLKNVLGIKLDIDLRDASHLTTHYVGPIADSNAWTEEELTEKGLPMTLLGKHHFNYVWKNNSHLESVNESSIGEGVVRCCVPAKTGHGFPSWEGFFSSDTSKQSVWYAFNAMYESVKKGEPLVFHCSHGKDRGGTLAYVIHGVLGIAKSEATKDFLISWFDNPDETVLVSSINNNIVNKLKNYNSAGTLKQQCEAYLKECGVKSGLTADQATTKIAEFQSLMLEEIETADENPNQELASTVSSAIASYVTYPTPKFTVSGSIALGTGTTTATLYYSLNSSDCNQTAELTLGEDGAFSYDIAYANSTDTLTWYVSVTTVNEGKSVTNQTNSATVTRTRDSGNITYCWTGAAGDGKWSNMANWTADTTYNAWGYPGLIDANSAYYRSTTKFDSRANNAVIDLEGNAYQGRDGNDAMTFDSNVGPVTLKNGTFYFNKSATTIGASGATVVFDGMVLNRSSGSTSFTLASASGFTMRFVGAQTYVEGGLIFSGTYGFTIPAEGLGAAPLKAKTLTAGAATIEVDVTDYTAAGQIPLMTFTGSVSNPKSSLTLVTKVNGQTVTGRGELVWSSKTLYYKQDKQEVVDPDQPGGETPETPEIPPSEGGVTTNAMADASWGYIVSGLGDNHNETAVVFTNENATAMTWTVPETLNNVKFLVVGGGGGAGGAASYNISSGQYNRGGAGGGGGGVVTGLVDFVEGSIVSVTVGKGGEGGVRVNNTTNGTAAAKSAGAKSSFSIGETSYVIARGGGRDLGLGKSGGYGGSNAGSRTTSRQEKFSWEDTDVNTTYITAYEKLGNFGGVAYSKTNNVRAGAGGGGATEEGYSCTDKSNAAKGGKGLTSDITGVSAVYGSGGGGGSGYEGSGAAGGSVEAGAGGNSSSSTTPNDGGDGLANYGGGGGGAGREGKGGNGGSGIVVFRYMATPTTEPEEPVLTAVDAPAAVAELIYTGSELTGVVAADGYTLTGNTATDAGTYKATATLAEGYKWSDDTTEPKTISWSIAKATNEWTTEPSISLESWTQGETAGVLTSGVAKFGEVTSSMTELPTAVGKYTITYTVVETDNYSGLTKEVSFEILKKPASYDFTVGDVALTDGKLTFKGNFAIDGESEATEMNLVVSVYDVAEGGDALKTVTVEGVPAGEFNQEIDIAALELADGVYYLAFEVQDEAGNVLDKVEERSMLTIGEAKAVKPTVNYASGTKFTAIGVEQKPVVTPADGNGYTVSYEGDFTAAGTHRIVIALKDGWTWSDGTSDSLTYEYEFIERTYTEYYIKPRGGASEGGTFQSDDRWYTDPEFAAGSKMSTCPNVYDAHNIANIPSDSQCWLFIDNESDIVLKPKFGKFTVDGNLRIVTYSGGLMFQNDTATPMPIWEVESGVSTIEGVVFDVNGSGTGYIDIAANTTNALGGVNYYSGFESSKKLFVRFSDEATAGSALRVYDFEDYYITNFGWFEGGAEGSTYALDIDEGVLSLNNPDAVSGVAGDLAITVKLGDKVGAANAYLNVAGTLNINEGSTLTVDANSMPCGVYTIINAATFNGADLLTSAAGATVTGLAEFTSGELVREGNKIVLYIETTIPPRVPGIEGDSVATNAVFETARVAKPIWYKTMPAINGDEITFNRVTVKVPEYYDVTLETLADGYLVNLKLKDNLKAFIANKVENDQIVTPAIRIENEKVYIHLENTKSDLYYTLLKSTKLGAEAEWKQTEEYAIGKADFEYTPAEGEAETCFFKAGDVMDEPPAK